jgi:hypothetical protein
VSLSPALLCLSMCAFNFYFYLYLSFHFMYQNKEGDLTNVRIHLEVHVCMIVPSIGRQYVNLEVYHNFRENRFIDFVTFLSACPLLFVKAQDSSLHLNRCVSSKTQKVFSHFHFQFKVFDGTRRMCREKVCWRSRLYTWVFYFVERL